MKITITSASWNLLSHDSFESITMMTETGEITILPNHQPLLSVVRPWILSLKYKKNGKIIDEEYITWWWVVTISYDEVIIIIDSINSVDDLDDSENIEKLKNDAQKIMQDYQNNSTGDIDPKKAMELEYEYLKYSAMQKLIKQSSLNSSNSRK